MNNKIDRTKTETARYGVRSIALVLFFVMLLTAIGSGSVLSAFAVAKSDAPSISETVAADDDVYAAAADEFDTEATMLSIAPEEEEEEPAVSLPQKKSGDIAVTGANADLAETGWTVQIQGKIYFAMPYTWTSNNSSVQIGVFKKAGGASPKWTLNHINGTDLYYAQVDLYTDQSSVEYTNKFVIANDSAKGDYDNYSYYSHKTNEIIYDYNNKNQYYSIYYSSTDVDQISTTQSNNSARGNATNRTQKAIVYTGGSKSEVGGTISVSYKSLSADSTASTYTFNTDSASGDDYYAVPALTTLTATPKSGYKFDGWYTAGTGGSALSTSTSAGRTASVADTGGTLTYHVISQDYAVYARFSPLPTYTATITSDGGTIGTEKSADASITTSSSTAGSATSATTYSGTNVYVYTNQNSGYKATVTAATTGGTSVSVTADSAKKFRFSMPSSAVNVTVTYSEASYVPVRVYAGTGGSVAVVYNGATTNVSAGSNKTVRVLEGDSINLTATAATNYTFSKWKKNLNDSYKTTAAITGETISDETVYVAVFTTSASSSDWIASSSKIDASPASATSTSVSNFTYCWGTGDTSLTNNYKTPTKTTGSGNPGYWTTFTSTDLSNKDIYFCLSGSNAPGNDIIGNGSETINTEHKDSGTTVTFSDTTGVLFKVEAKTNGTYNNSGTQYMHISGVDTSRIDSIGVMTYFGGGTNYHGAAAHYQFYYKVKTSSGTDTSYSPGVTFYAKDCGLNESSTNNEWFGNDTDTTVVQKSGLVTITDSYDKYVKGSAVKGTTITVTTTIPNTGTLYGTRSDGTKSSALTARQKYYVAGYLFNGKTPKQLEWNSDGVYTCDYTIPADMTENYLEITPVYFIKDDYAYNTTVFYVQGYDDTVQSNGWGSTLFVYPYYKRYTSGTSGDTSYLGQAENFGAYSGQPMLNLNGQIVTQIPLTDDGSPNGKDNNNPIKGMTISNGFYDMVHRNATGLSVHRQTYDYDDFAKIQKEKANVNGNKLHSIFYTFKFYESKKTDATQHRKYDVTSTYYGSNYKAYYNNGSQADRYNDLFTTDGNRPGNGSSIAKSTLETYGTNTTGWEDLTDALGNKVDLFGNSVDTSKSELKVFSIGYEWNNAGLYATEWAVYAPTTATGTTYKLVGATTTTTASNSSIVPSALILNSSSRFTDANYPQLDGDQSITGYKDLYTALSAYKNYPVKISYEREVPSKDDEAYRCDGRWTYTTDKDFVRSSIIIEYDDKDGNQHRYGGTGDTAPDTFISGTNQGTNTLSKAYFTNEDYEGAVVSDSEEISNTAQYTFKAEEGGSYEFVGWYLYDKDGKVQPLSEDFEAKTTRSNNYTIAARFKYVASGKLKISAGLASGEEGRGTVYLGVAVKASGSSSYYDVANAATNTASVTLDSDYINTSENYTVKVTVRTAVIGENVFSAYNVNSTNANDESTVASNTEFTTPDTGSGTATQEFEFTVNGNIFSGNDQIVKGLEYLATLTPPTYNYSFKFQYPSRQYGTQAYTASGTLTTSQINNENYVGGTTGGTGRYVTPTFIQKVIPHESNFNKDINFTISDNVTASSYNGTTNTYTFTATFVGTETAAESNTKHGVFYVPYTGTNDNADRTLTYEINNEDGLDQVNADDGVVLDDFSTYNAFDYTTDYDVLYHVTAPVQLKINDEVKFFHYWSARTAEDGSGEAHEVLRCYFPEYNYRARGDYDIYAVYGDEANYNVLYSENAFTTVDFIGNNRNQWNGGGADKGTAPYDDGDLVYNDFIFTFKPASSSLINTFDAGTTKIGMILQQLDEVATATDSSGNLKYIDASGKTKTLSQCATAAEAGPDVATLQSFAAGTSTKDTSNHLVKYSFSLENVDNKNRYHSVLPLYNSRTGKPSLNNCKYLYRAYSYMIIDGTTYISETPTYFYMYDIANK